MKIWNTPEVETLKIENTACHDETPVCEQASGAVECEPTPCQPVTPVCGPQRPHRPGRWGRH
ncbi:hypothetical protein [Butyrivibrio sp. MC2013]|uniref:hypothetical protein n=1 Tax=Butyrivibrio sp. MC2013 TaxID=1280686 RepID=UPI000405EBB9|nr:hypothetical protein [Butyrivibrio sp. MC2013]